MKHDEKQLNLELSQQDQERKEQIRKKTLKKIRKSSQEVKERNRFTEEYEHNPQQSNAQGEPM